MQCKSAMAKAISGHGTPKSKLVCPQWPQPCYGVTMCRHWQLLSSSTQSVMWVCRIDFWLSVRFGLFGLPPKRFGLWLSLTIPRNALHRSERAANTSGGRSV